MNRFDTLAFTLIEVMIAISIFAVISSMSLPSFRNYLEYIELVTATNKLVFDLQWARRTAIRSKLKHGVLFLPNEGKYQIFREDDNEVLNEVNLREKRIEMQNPTFPSKGIGYAVVFQSLGNIAGHNGRIILAKRDGKKKEIVISSNAGELNIR